LHRAASKAKKEERPWKKQPQGRRHWLKCGSLKVEATKKNLQALNLLPGLEVREVSEVASEELLEEFELAPQPFRYKTTPFNHQVRAMEKILSPREYPNVFALFLEQGLGKTKTLIDWAGMLHAEKKISGVLVVSKKGVHRQWVESELPAHSAAESQTFTWPFKPEELDKKPGFQWAAFNIDGIKTKKGLEVATLFAKRHSKRLMIIVDESQEIKNHRTQRWKALEGLKKYSSHRAIATGTPIAKDFCDEWAQLRWLEEGILGIRYITAFKAEFCILGGYNGYDVIGHKNIARFRKLVDPYTFRVTKEDVGILPKMYNEWRFNLTQKQKQMIKELKATLFSSIESGAIVSAANAATQLDKFRQVSSGFFYDENKVAHRIMEPKDNPRATAVLEWLESFTGKAAIWAYYREDIKIIAELLTEAGITFVEYHGGVCDNDRVLAVKSFMSKDGARVLLATPSSAGTGLNLQGLCNNALYYSHSFRALDRWQSEDRIHRIGTKGVVVCESEGGEAICVPYMRNVSKLCERHAVCTTVKCLCMEFRQKSPPGRGLKCHEGICKCRRASLLQGQARLLSQMWEGSLK
jgi:SNF2 family DNA or RNA helicase